MDYNKDSFLAGIAVGRRLKGWSGGPGGGGGSIEKDDRKGIIFNRDMTFIYGDTGKVFDASAFIFGEYTEGA